MRLTSIAVLCSLALAAPGSAAAQGARDTTARAAEPATPAQPATRARIEAAPTLLDRLMGREPATQAPQQLTPEPQAAAQAPPRRADRRRAERPSSAAEPRSARREARRPAPASAAPAPVARADQPIPTPPPHPLRAAEEAIASVAGETNASTGEDPTALAYASADDPRERCHVVLASEVEHDIAEVLRCRVLLHR
jgi:hypothetical protein